MKRIGLIVVAMTMVMCIARGQVSSDDASIVDTTAGHLATQTMEKIKVDSNKTAYRSIVLTAVGGVGGTSASAALPQAVATTYVNSVPVRTVGFASDSTRYMTWDVYMPSNWDSTGGLTYKVYSLTDTLEVDTVFWNLEAASISTADTLTPAFGTALGVIQVTQTSTGLHTYRTYQTAESGVLRASGTNKPSALMIFRLSRVLSATDYTNYARLIWVRVSYRINNYSDR